MSVAGVAIATVLSQLLAVVLILRYLRKTDTPIHMEWKKLRIHGQMLSKMIRIGLPAGVQGSLFALSNVIIQSSVNSFGSVVMAGNSAAANIEGFCYSALNACNQTSLNFTSQNRGARQYHRTSQVLRIGVGIALVTGAAFAVFGVTFAGSLVSIYSSEAEVISYGILRLTCILPFYWMSGIMEVLVGYIRGIGYSLMSTIVTLLGSCAFRIIWVYTVFRAQGTLESLYVSYPISWAITICAHVVCMVVTCRKYWGKKDAAESAA